MRLDTISRNIENYFRHFPEMYELDSWYLDFFKIFDNSDCSKDLLNEVKTKFLDESTIINNQTHLWKTAFLESRVAFFDYLKSKECLKDTKYLNDCLVYILKNIRVFGNGIPAFISYIVISNYDDIKFKCEIKDDKAVAGCYLDDYRISSVVLDKTSLGIRFDSVETKPMLTNNNIGALTFKRLCEELKTSYPEDILYTDNVWAFNYGGIRFYEGLGGKISKNSIRAGMKRCIFDIEAINNISKMNISKPELYPSKRIYVDDPTVEIKQYLEDLTRAQKELSDKRIKIFPKEQLTPQAIVLSRNVVEKMIADDYVECFGATNDPFMMKFAWSNESGTKLIVNLKITEFGDYELISMYKKNSDYMEYLYDVETDERKRGILLVSSKNDEISTVYRLSR